MNKWQLTSDRPPKRQQKVLIYSDALDIRIARYKEDGKGNHWYDVWVDGKHWSVNIDDIYWRKEPLPPILPEREWLSISTAPKDGTIIELWHIKLGRMNGLWWDKVFQEWSATCENECFSHWRPQPIPPGHITNEYQLEES